MDTSEEDLTEQEQARITGVLLTLRIITGALIMGVASFAAIMVYLGGGDPPNGPAILFWLALAATVLAIILGQIMPKAATGHTKSGEWDIEKALALYSTRLIVGLAILEGAAFFDVIAFYLSGRWLLLGAAAILIGFMFAKFPSRRSLVRWIEERRQLAELGGNE